MGARGADWHSNHESRFGDPVDFLDTELSRAILCDHEYFGSVLCLIENDELCLITSDRLPPFPVGIFMER